MGDKVQKLEKEINILNEEIHVISIQLNYHDQWQQMPNWSTWRIAPGEIT